MRPPTAGLFQPLLLSWHRLVLKLGRRASEHVAWNITCWTFSQNGVRGANVNQKQFLSVSSAFKECGLVVSWWHYSYTSLYMEEKT